MIKVSFQGERGAYSEAAARSFFTEEVETIPLSTFKEVLESTISNKTTFSVLPVENSLEGSVGESYDLLYSTSLNAMGEIYHRIEHCLIGNGKLEEIDTVYSHPQALGQCRDFIQNYHMKTVPTYDTAGSVKIIKEIKKTNVACIASKTASEIYKMPIISEKIANNLNNYTRFLVLSQKTSKETGNDKTSIMFSVKDRPGALFSILKHFARHRINLTKIESRPSKKKAWEYIFFVDMEGHIADKKVDKAVEEVMKECLYLTVLGSYPSAE